MRFVIYCTALFFNFYVYASDLAKSRDNLSLISTKFGGSQEIDNSDASCWRVLCRKFNYTIMERPDGIKSFRFFPLKKLRGFNLLIDNEQDTYLLKTTRNPISYCQILMQDCDELLGTSQEEKKDALIKMSIEDLAECLKKENQKILCYKDKVKLKHEVQTVEEMVVYAAENYQIRSNKLSRPNPFLAELYAQEIIRRNLSSKSINPFSFKSKSEE